MIPHVLHLGAAYRNADTGAVIVAPVVAGAATSANDDAISLSAVYDLTQNVALHLNYSAYSGGARTAAQGSSLTTFMLEAAW